MTEYKITRLGHKGDGIADGPIFAPRVLPGEVIEGEIADGRIAKPKIVKPSPDRVSPPCKHAKSCGGCALQHAADPFVAEWKTQIVRDALAAHGLDAPIKGIHTSPPASRRRATFSGRRTKSGAQVGFHGPASDTIIPVPNCELLRTALIETLPILEEITKIGTSRKAELRLTLTEMSNGLDLSIENGKPLDLQLIQDLTGLTGGANFARLTWNGEQVAQFQRPILFMGSAPVSPPAGSFLQATTEGEAALLDGVKAALTNVKGPILDLFAGCGTFSLPMASTHKIHAVEGEASMIAALDAGWRHGTNLRDVTTETRDLFRRPMMPDELNTFGGIVIDPPRAGAEAQCREIAKSEVPYIAFVSCNPTSFARDAAILVGAGFHLEWIEVVDQFRWSTHVELVAGFVR